MEFSIIEKYFTWKNTDKTILNSVGDDCAIIQNPQKLAISTDTFTQDVHFFENTAPQNIAHKALAVNLSDLAAMGATPKYFTLNLSLPKVGEAWLADFSQSLQSLAKQYNLNLIGGDTTQSSVLSITITIFGECKSPIFRGGAQVGDGIFVSGELGGAKLALEQILNAEKIDKLALKKLEKPTPQVKLGKKLSKIATSCIDISDGLVADLGHILQQSNCGANLWSAKIPIFTGSSLDYALYGGDDYELCWTANLKSTNETNAIQIGEITKDKNLKLDNKVIKIKGYSHF